MPADTMNAWLVHHVGYSCDNNCLFCIVQYKRHLALPRTEQLIAEMKSVQFVQRYYFTGGEPTLREDLTVLIESALPHANEVWIQTNGRRLAQAWYVDDLVSLPVTGALISLHVDNEGDSRHLVGVSGAFQEAVSGIGNALDRGLEVETNTVVTKYNYEALPRIARFIRTTFDGVRAIKIVYAAFNPLNTTGHYVPLRQAASHIRATLEELPLGLCEVENIPLCVLDLRRYQANFSDSRRLVALISGKLHFGASQRSFIDVCDFCSARQECQGIHCYYPVHFDPSLDLHAI